MLGTNDENYKKTFQNLKGCVLQYVVENYKKWVDIVHLTRKLEDVYLSSK